MPPRSPHGQWSSAGAFVLVGAGAAIGLGNIWRFPCLVTQYGGTAFVLVYVAALLLLTVPLLVAELLIGRRARLNPVTAMRRLAAESDGYRTWSAVGWLALAGAVMVMSYYSVIAGWSLAYLFRAVGGMFDGAAPDQVRALFHRLVSEPERGLAWHTLFTLCAAAVVSQGVRGGLQRVSRCLVPLAWALLVLLLLWVALTRDGFAAVEPLLRPDFKALGIAGALEALTQAFFSLSLGLGVMMAYGAYLPERASLSRLALAIVLIDTVFAIVAVLVVVPSLMAAGEPPVFTTRLVFEAMPQALDLANQRWPGVAFYLMVVLVALFSSMALLEVLVSWIVERLRIGRPVAAALAGLCTWTIGLGTLLSFNLWQQAQLFGRTYYQWLEWLSSRLLLPVAGLLICIFVSTIMRDDLVRQSWGEIAGRSYGVWRFLLRFPARIGLIILLAHGLGLLTFFLNFW